jgi:hypothetical protein
MDRKLSINPAIKKQHQLIQTERCLSSSTSIDSPSDMSNSSSTYSYLIINHVLLQIIDNTNDLPIVSMPVACHPNGGTMQQYYNTAAQPYFHFSIPSHPVYCPSGSAPVWHHYFSGTNNYPVTTICFTNTLLTNLFI